MSAVGDKCLLKLVWLPEEGGAGLRHVMLTRLGRFGSAVCSNIVTLPTGPKGKIAPVERF